MENKNIYFCKSWFRAKKQAIEIWSEDKASKMHKEQQLYTVLVGSQEKPSCFLEVTKDFVGVSFLDSNLRVNLDYQFQEVEPGKLFLSMAVYREFLQNSDKVTCGTCYTFQRDGVVKIKREYFDPHRIETSESRINVDSNYSSYPEFGKYDDLIKVERI